MPIQKSHAALSFQGGIQSKTDALQLQPPALLELQNACFSKVGQLNKRFGFNVLTNNILNGNIIQSAFAIDSFNNELNLFDNNNIYTYLSSNGNWANRGTAVSLINSNQQIIRSSTSQQLNPDSCVLGGMELYVWEDSRSGGARYSIIDTKTQAYAVADQPLFGYRPRVVAFNNKFYLSTTNDIGAILIRTISPTNPTVITPPNPLIQDLATNTAYDIIASAVSLYIAYSSTTANFSIKQFNTSLIQTSSYSTSAAPATTLNMVIDSKNQLWTSYSISTGINVSVNNATTVSTLITTFNNVDSLIAQTMTGIEYSTPGQLQLTYECPSTTTNPSDQFIKSVILDPIFGTITNVGTLRSVGLASRAFKYNNNIFVNTTHQSNLQSTYFTILLNNEPFTVVGKVSAQVGGGLITNNMLGNTNQPIAGVFKWANLVKGQYLTADNIGFSLLGVNATTTDFTNINKFNSVTSSNNLLFVGGILQSYDGVSAAEQNFNVCPENISFTVIPGAGALSVGQYEYQVVYAWSDNEGQIQYSTPSSPIIVSCPIVNSAVILKIDTCRLTAKSNISIKIYRTQANQTVLQEVTNPIVPLKNDSTVDYVIFDDTLADSQITSNATIYTTGGVLPNSAPPSCSLITLYQNRVMIAGLEDKNLIWFSKNKFNNTNFNTIPVEFSALNTIGVDPRGGPKGITALALMDSNLIIFKENAIFLLNGDGPDDTGNGSFPDPELISSNLGCDNANSIIITKDGLMFQSAKGIWLLDRSFGLSYIGQGVDDFNSYSISSATLDPNDNLIYFTTTNGPTLVYDYFIGQWSTWTGACNNIIDSVVFEDLFTMVKSNGQVYTQNRNSFIDAVPASSVGNPIIMEIVTPWISSGQMLGWQAVFRAYLLGQYKGQHQLSVSIGYNFDSVFLPQNTALINATSISGQNTWGSDNADGYSPGYTDGYWGSSSVWGGTYQPYQFQINFKQQRCTSFRLKIADSQVSPYTEGYTLNSLNLEMGVFPGGVQLPVTSKVSTGYNQ